MANLFDIAVARKLSGGGGGGSSESLIVRKGEYVDDRQFVDKTYGEIREAYLNNRQVIFEDVYDDGVTINRARYNLVQLRESKEFGSWGFTLKFSDYSDMLSTGYIESFEDLLNLYPYIYSD